MTTYIASKISSKKETEKAIFFDVTSFGVTNGEEIGIDWIGIKNAYNANPAIAIALKRRGSKDQILIRRDLVMLAHQTGVEGGFIKV